MHVEAGKWAGKWNDSIQPALLSSSEHCQLVLSSSLYPLTADLAGYHVIGDETTKFLAPLMRKKMAKP